MQPMKERDEEIYCKYMQGFKKAYIARQYGISPTRVTQIIYRIIQREVRDYTLQHKKPFVKK